MRIGSFFRSIRIPLIASSAMLGALFALRHVSLGSGSVASLITGLAVGAVVYVATFLLVPGGWIEVRKVVADLKMGMRQG